MGIAEAALVFDAWGRPIYWHVPDDRSSGALPDSRKLWEVLWDNRYELGGVAHTHPWDGETGPSGTDVTTFAAIEAGLGQRLIWPIATFTHVRYLEWVGPGKHDYGDLEKRRFRIRCEDINHLRDLSR